MNLSDGMPVATPANTGINVSGKQKKEPDTIPSEKLQILIKKLVDQYQGEDRAVRERQIRQWRQMKFYWDNLTNIWWSDTAHDWRVWDAQVYQQSYADQAYYDKRVNVFRAYLESIIAALSVTVPVVTCSPDNADDPMDLSTAKAGDKIYELINRHNDGSLLWLHALFIFCTEGMVAGYTYTEEKEEYGTYDVNKWEDETLDIHQCPSCGMELPPEMFEQSKEIAEKEEDEFDPAQDDILIGDMLNSGELSCPYCMIQLDPELQKSQLIVPRLVGTTKAPKTRVCNEAFGGLYVKVANYARKQKETPYLIYSYEVHYSLARAEYECYTGRPDKANKVQPGSGGVWDPYEAWGRLSTQYLGEYPVDTVTIRKCWIRYSGYNALNNEEDVKLLRKHFPSGIKATFINDEFVEGVNECLDDHWTLTYNPLSDYVHYQPLGQLLTTIQDITNELLSLVMQTIEHGIPQTFADDGVLDFDAYNQVETAPGMIFPAKPKGGKSLGDAFHEVKTATLGQEVLPFGQEVQQLGQLASGALPSLFGGSQPNSSKTAAQYSMSKNQAMQRLQTPWKMLTMWWKNMYGKAIPMYMKNMVEDERFVKKDKLNNPINVFIAKSEMQGKIGEVELVGAENLPESWMQKKDTLMQFLQAADPVVMQALVDPQNLPLVAEAVGLSDFILPGADDREKQYEEINILINSQPIVIPTDPMEMMQGEMMGQQIPPEQEMPSVDIEPDVDNGPVHIAICKGWLVSDVGRFAKVNNPQGYKNVLLHLKQHLQLEMQNQMMAQMQQQPPGSEGESKGSSSPQNDKAAAPVKVNTNVS